MADGFEFRQMLMVQLLLRENAYAVICRTRGGRPYKLVPVNSDRVAIWEAPSGEIFYRVTPLGLHEMAELQGQPFLIPAEDVIHLRGLSLNGLLGSSRMVLHKDAIGLSIAQEAQQARWMRAGSNPGGILTTESRLGPGTAKRVADDWRTLNAGMDNSGKVAVLEQGLKFEKLGLSATDIDFMNGRQFQRQELALILRIPPHMIGIIQGRSTGGGVVDQQAAEYLNFTLTGHTQRIGDKFDQAFDISGMGMFMDWDYSILTRADQRHDTRRIRRASPAATSSRTKRASTTAAIRIRTATSSGSQRTSRMRQRYQRCLARWRRTPAGRRGGRYLMPKVLQRLALSETSVDANDDSRTIDFVFSTSNVASDMHRILRVRGRAEAGTAYRISARTQCSSGPTTLPSRRSGR